MVQLRAVRTREMTQLLRANYIKIISKLNRNANERESKKTTEAGRRGGKREKERDRESENIHVSTRRKLKSLCSFGVEK